MNDSNLDILWQQIQRHGYHLFRWNEDVAIDTLARRIGRPVASASGRPLIDVLVPKAVEDSAHRTLSAIHGVGAFPFHTETAHWRKPVDLVVLRCVNPGAAGRSTRLIDGWKLNLDEEEIKRLSFSLMVVKNGARSFLAPLVERGQSKIRFRYDSGCMRPAFDKSAESFAQFADRLNASHFREIPWERNLTLILDNRRMLHARAAASTMDEDRQLERVYVVKQC